jgi:sphingolipid delta-4 desaturase
MTAPKRDFVHSDAPEPHRARTKALLRDHPEIRDLIGPNPWTFLFISGIAALQIAIAWFVSDRSWWWVVGLAYTVGAFANHSLFVLIHETAHKLVFKKKLPNVLAGFVANIPLFFPSSVAFKRYHLKHHAFQGVYELDADLPYHWEARLVGRSFIGKALWLMIFPVFQALRPLRLKEVKHIDAWTITNLVVQVGIDLALLLLWGPQALVYVALSFFFSIGLHPLGARWVQRHYLTGNGGQETFSYYGRLNLLAFNVGYHNEHHDFPSVPWNKLPRIKAIAPEAYENLHYHKSWTRLFFRFLFDKELTLYSRVTRDERGGVKLNDEVKPDLDELQRKETAPV